MTQIGYYSPQTARVILDVVTYLRNNGFIDRNPRRFRQEPLRGDEVYIRNVGQSEIPAFGIVQASGTVDEGGQNYVEVAAPTDTVGIAGPFLINGFAPIEVGPKASGRAQVGNTQRVVTDTGTITCGSGWKPQVGLFTATAGCGQFVAYGADDIKENVARIQWSTTVGMHYRFTLTSAFASGVASATITDMDGDATGVTGGTVRDPELIFTNLTTGDTGICTYQGGCLFNIQAPC